MDLRVRASRAEQNAAHRSAVLDAAWHVFRELGYGAASLDRIAEAAGFSKGVVYSRFGSKADLFLALLERRIDERAISNLDQLEGAIAAGATGIDAVARRLESPTGADRDWMLALLEFRLTAARDPELNERYVVLHRTTVDRLAGLFDALADRLGTPLGVGSRSLALTMLAFDSGTALEQLGGGSIDPADRVEIISRMLTPARRRPVCDER